MKTEKARAIIVWKERLNNSISGNPRYEVGIIIPSVEPYGESLYGKTASDASCNYGNWDVDAICDVSYHITRVGNVVFDRISEPIRP